MTPIIKNSLSREIFRDFGIAFLMIERGIHWIISWEENYSKATALFGRRKGDKKMSLISTIEMTGSELSALMTLEPLIVKFVEDAIAAAPQLETDGKAILAKVETIFHYSPSPAPAPTPAA